MQTEISRGNKHPLCYVAISDKENRAGRGTGALRAAALDTLARDGLTEEGSLNGKIRDLAMDVCEGKWLGRGDRKHERARGECARVLQKRPRGMRAERSRGHPVGLVGHSKDSGGSRETA